MFSDGINTATLNDFYAYQSGGDKRFETIQRQQLIGRKDSSTLDGTAGLDVMASPSASDFININFRAALPRK